MSAIEMLNPEDCECHSPQEQRIFDQNKGKKDKHYDTHKRVFDLIAKFEGQPPTLTWNAPCTSPSPWPPPKVSPWCCAGPRR